jgi:hypothetical protein
LKGCPPYRTVQGASSRTLCKGLTNSVLVEKPWLPWR